MQELKQLAALQAKVHCLQTKVKQQNATIRRLKQRNSELQISRTRWKNKRHSAATGPSSAHKSRHQLRPQGYTYSVALIGLCVRLYLVVGCGYRGIVRMLLAWQLQGGYPQERIPAKSSIALWVEKLGCHRYTSPLAPTQPYALIVDECMVVGQQRLMVCLAVDATKHQLGATTYQAVEVVHLQVRPAWTGADIETMLETVSHKLGAKPRYVISDGNTNLCCGLRQGGYTRICDVSHQVALLVGHHYQQRAEFVGWQKALSMTRFKGIMQAHAYLLPPKQRTIARFMNLSASISWSRTMLASLAHLSQSERVHFDWLEEYRAFVEELNQVFSVTEGLVSHLKVHGLSAQTCQASMQRLDAAGPLVPACLVACLRAYVASEWGKLPTEVTSWHCCSNVIESLFGHYKARLASHPFNGITGQVLSLPLRTGRGLGAGLAPALEAVRVSVLLAWKQANLPANLVVKRRKVLKK